MAPPTNRATTRDDARARALAAIPRWYRPWAHLAATAGIGAAVWIAALFALFRSPPRFVDALVPPLVFLMANALEWAAHKHLLHKRRWPLHELFDRHTPEHHSAYVDGDMAIRDVRELRLVLIPAVGVLGIVLAMCAFGAAFAALLGASAGWLFVLTASSYVVGYELSHLAYHLPEAHPVGRLRAVAILREHHSIHHDPSLMQKRNFNVTIPLFDWLLGTALSRSAMAHAAQMGPRDAPAVRD